MVAKDPRRAARAYLRWVLGSAVIAQGAPLVAAASEVRTATRTIGEGYMVRVPGPSGQLLGRRRLVQYVNLGVYRLLPPKRPKDGLVRREADGQLHIVTSLRLRHDFGDFVQGATGVARNLLETTDGRQIDLLYGYLEGRSLGGRVDLRLGRQYEFSGLDFYAFDGAFVRVHAPLHLAFDAFGGVAVDGSAVLGEPTFELDGTQGRAVDRSISPMFGVAVALDGLALADARLAYRRMSSPDPWNLAAVDPASSGPNVDQELLSATLALHLKRLHMSPYGALRYNLGVARLDDVSGGVAWTITPKIVTRIFYVRAQPTFDLDSIFNVFAFEPLDDLRLVVELRPSARWTLALRLQTRFEHANVTAERGHAPTRRLTAGGGGGVAALLRRRRFSMRLDGYGQTGSGSLRAGAAADTRTHIFYDRIALDGRVYGVVTRQADRSGTLGSFAVQAGVAVHLTHGIVFNVIAEELVSSTLRHAFRMFGTFSMDWAFRVGGRG